MEGYSRLSAPAAEGALEDLVVNGGHIHRTRHMQVTLPEAGPRSEVPALCPDSYSLWLKTEITFVVSSFVFTQGEARVSLSQGCPWFPSLCLCLCLWVLGSWHRG